MRHVSYIKNKTSTETFIWNGDEFSHSINRDNYGKFRIFDHGEYIGQTNINFIKEEVDKANDFMKFLPKDNDLYGVGTTHVNNRRTILPSIEDPHKMKQDIYDFLHNNIDNFFTVEALEIEKHMLDSTLENDQGLCYNNYQEFWTISIGFIVKDNTTKDKQDIFKFSYVNQDFTLDNFLQDLKNSATNILNPCNIKQGTYDVMLDQGVSECLVGDILSMLYGNSIFNNSSSVKIGDQVFPEHVTIVEDPFSFLPVDVDCDGNPLKEKVLINNGKVNNIICNNKFAKKLGLETTGNCFDFSVALSNIKFSGLKCYKTHMKSFTGILITSILGVDFNSVNGMFSCSIKGFFVDNGTSIKSFLNGTISFSIFDVAKKAIFLDDINSTNGSFSCPSIFIPNQKIGGF